MSGHLPTCDISSSFEDVLVPLCLDFFLSKGESLNLGKHSMEFLFLLHGDSLSVP